MDYSTKEDIVERFLESIKRLILPSKDNNYKSRFLQSNMLLYCVVLLLVLKIVFTFASLNFPQNIFFADITKSVLESFVNQTRQSVGLPALVENQKLDEAAQLKAQNMVQDNYFDHTSPTGVTPWYWFSQAGYVYKYAGENLAIGFFDSAEVYQAWLNSPSHKANILNPNYKEVGTAILAGFGQNNTIVVVQEFGSQLPAKTVATKTVVNLPKTNVTVKTQEKIPAASTQAVNSSPTFTNNGKVLSQTTESKVSLEPAKATSENNLTSKLLNFAIYNYDVFLQYIIYGVFVIVIAVLSVLIFMNFHVDYKKQLVFRAVLIVILLSVATLINKDIIISLIPHQVII